MNYKLSILLFTLAFSTIASADFVGPGASSKIDTVKSIIKINDNTRFTLEGYIVKKIKPEHYMFKDSTGEIEIELDNGELMGIKVTPKTKVIIGGVIDEDSSSTAIGIDSIEIAK